MSEQHAISLARRFHNAYEQLAPSFGYQTRPETRVFDPASPNGRLMVAVVKRVIGELKDEIDANDATDSGERHGAAD